MNPHFYTRNGRATYTTFIHDLDYQGHSGISVRKAVKLSGIAAWGKKGFHKSCNISPWLSGSE